MSLATRLFSVLGVLLAAAPVTRADVLVKTLDGKPPVRGISLTADAQWVSVHSAQGPVVKIAADRIVEIVTVPQPAAPPPLTRPFELMLTDGSRLRGQLGEAPDDHVRLRSAVLRETGGQLDILLDFLMAVHRVDGTKIPRSRIVRIPEKDAAYRLSGKGEKAGVARVEGTLERFTGTGIEIERDLGLSRISYRDLAAILVDNQAIPAPKGLHVVARLVDGSEVVLTKAFRVAGGMLSGKTPSGLSVRVSTARIAALGFQGGSFVHLSDLKPKKIERVPFFPVPKGPAADAMLDFVCPVRKDKSPEGRPITLKKRRYFKGLGVRPRTELTYDIKGNYSSFEALCGIDDEVLGPGFGRGAGTGSVIFAVEVDGRRVAETGVVEGGKEPVPLRVPLKGARVLKLIVMLVPQGRMPKGVKDSPELDNAVWARPLLIR